MPTTTQPSDAQLLSKLRRTKKGKTAGELGVSATRLRSLEGVEVIGTQQTGKRGRPALIFAVKGE